MLEHEFILNYARTDPEEFGNPGELDTSAAFKPRPSGRGRIRPLSVNPEQAPGFSPGCVEWVDWQYILKQARAHNVVSLLYNNIKNLPAPLNIIKELEKIYTYTAFHNMLYLEELNRILEKANNIIILKGPMLAQNVYGNIGLRPFSDIDILVKKEELDEIKSILLDMGYSTNNESFYKKYHFHLPLVKMDKIPVHIELHWSFVDKFILQKIDMAGVWNAKEKNVLPLEINILYLLLHIEKHAFFNKAIYNSGNPRDWIFTNPFGNQLIWYTDLYETIKKYGVNWKRLIKLANEWCIQNIVYYNLYILNKLYAIPDLANLPQPRLSLPKKIIYNIASEKASFELQADMQLRPIRAVDLVNYLFPPVNILRKYYCTTKYIPVIIYYFLHFYFGAKEIFSEFIGICNHKLYTRKKKESPVAN